MSKKTEALAYQRLANDVSHLDEGTSRMPARHVENLVLAEDEEDLDAVLVEVGASRTQNLPLEELARRFRERNNID